MRYSLVVAASCLFLIPASAPAQVYGDPNSLVDHWYRTYLGRAPDTGMSIWVNDLAQGAPADQVLASILGSDEYYQRAGATPAGYVTRLFNDFLNRPPNPADMNFWIGRMYTENRQLLALEFLDQNPAEWVGPNVPPESPGLVAPPVVTAPLLDPGIGWYGGWNRDWHRDWDGHHDIHDYRHPDVRNHVNAPHAVHPAAPARPPHKG